MPAIKAGTSPNLKQAGQRRWINIAILLLVLLFLVFFIQILNQGLFNGNNVGFASLPVSIRAGSTADYSQDSHNYSIPPISENILNQIITDFPATGSPQDRQGTLQAVLLTPVPTMTLEQRLPAALTPGFPTPIPTRIAYSPTSPGFIPPLPTSTRFLPLTPTITLTYWTPTLPVPSATITPLPPTITSTPLPPPSTSTPTPTITSTPRPLPTSTPVPPKHEKPTKEPKPTKKPKPPKKP